MPHRCSIGFVNYNIFPPTLNDILSLFLERSGRLRHNLNILFHDPHDDHHEAEECSGGRDRCGYSTEHSVNGPVPGVAPPPKMPRRSAAHGWTVEQPAVTAAPVYESAARAP